MSSSLSLSVGSPPGYRFVHRNVMSCIHMRLKYLVSMMYILIYASFLFPPLMPTWYNCNVMYVLPNSSYSYIFRNIDSTHSILSCIIYCRLLSCVTGKCSSVTVQIGQILASLYTIT